MGKRILIPGLIALLLVAGVGAWLVLNPPGQSRGSESGNGILPALSNVEGDVSGGTPDATAHRQDADATSVQPGSRAGSKGESSGDSGGKTSRSSGTGSQSGTPTGSSNDKGSSASGGRSGDKSSGESAGKPAHSKIIDATRPPNQTLGNARPVSRVINTKPFKQLSEVSEKLKQDRRGLYAQYFAFTNDPLAELSKPEAKTLAQRDAALVRIDNQVHFPNNEAFADLPFSLQNFAATWDGYLVIPEQGEYWLFLGADNAARVDLDGETVLLNDVQSRYIEVSTVLELAPGLHPLHIEFAQGMLANEDSWRCAASFMYVPKGQQKPVPVPKEMLMVPEWMWSDDAPIITKLSKYEGEIGDEITIYGQGLAPLDPPGRDASDPEPGGPSVYFNGQKAHAVSWISGDSTGLRVRVPIGASSGKVIVFRGGPIAGVEEVSVGRTTPSNSVDFKVTTQFGLIAEWFDLSGVPSPSFESIKQLTPAKTFLDSKVHVINQGEVDPWLAERPFAVRWTGRIGIAPTATGKMWICAGAGLDSTSQLGLDGVAHDGRDERYVDAGVEHYCSIEIIWMCAGGDAGGLTVDVGYEGGMARFPPLLPVRFLFPPITPPKPPRVAAVNPIALLGDDQPSTPPFPGGGLISVREGQQFKCNVEIFGDEEVRAAPITLSVDDHAIECGSGTLIEDSANKRWFRQFVGVLPPGCGEGKLTAKLGLSTSEPFYIDVSNKGLIAYLYDLPNPGGYSQFPNILPLTLHTIRKDRDINFDTADSFKLPFVAETFAVEWYGAIIIDTDGWYTFTSRTDDGCRVWLNGIEIIDDDNLHAPQEKSSERIKLAPGIYPFRMQFFECNQHEECLLFVAATDLQEKELLTKQVVSKRMFTWEVHDMLPDKIATGKKADGSD